MSLHFLLMILHVLGAGLVIGLSVLMYLAFVRPPSTKQAIDRMMFAAQIGMFASGWQVLTGFGLMATEWDELGHDPWVWTKIILWAVQGFIAATVIKRQAMKLQAADAAGQPAATGSLPAWLLLHAVMVLAIAVIGVLIVSGGNE